MTSRIVRADGTTALSGIKSVTYHEAVNADTDLRPGCVASAYIEVECYGSQAQAPTAGERLAYYQVVDGTSTLVGYFYAEPSIPTKVTYKFIAYDAAWKLDADFSTWLAANQNNFPKTVYQLVSQACTLAGVTLGTSSWPMSTMSVNAFYADGITCRNILQYAAEIAGKFVRCNVSGSIIFDWYTAVSNKRIYPSSGTSGSEVRYAYKQDGLTYENFTTTVVARVAVHPVGEDDVAYYYPTNVSSGNTLSITNNALLYGATAATMNSIAQNLYSVMTALGTYRPMSVDMFPNECPFSAGQIVNVTDIQGVSFRTVIMEKTVTEEATTLESSGREVYGDYALDTAKQLVQLAADIVRINKLKVDWAEIGTAVVQTLQANGINADWINAGALTVKDTSDRVIFMADIASYIAQIGQFIAEYGSLTRNYSDSNGSKSFFISSDFRSGIGGETIGAEFKDASGNIVCYWYLHDYISTPSLSSYSGVEIMFDYPSGNFAIALTSNGIYFCSGGTWQVRFNGYALEFNGGNGSNWRSALGAVNKAGDTMTGNLIRQNSSVDTKDASNGISSGQWSGFQVTDKNGYPMSYFSTDVRTDGRTGTGMYVYNRDSSGNQVGSAVFELFMNKSGAVTYNLSSPAALRNALGLGNTSGALPVANGGTGATTAADACNNLNAPYVYSKSASASTKRTITFSNSARGMLIAYSTTVARCGVYLLVGTSSTARIVPLVNDGAPVSGSAGQYSVSGSAAPLTDLTGTGISYTTSANVITLTTTYAVRLEYIWFEGQSNVTVGSDTSA